MAGEWIKMRADLHDDPAVFRLASLLKIDKYSVIGRLHTFWSWADRHSVDGFVDGGASTYVDEIVRCEGFAESLEKVGWLEITDEGIRIPKFDRHNGDSAKQRALKNERQARWRAGKDADVDGDVDGKASTKTSTREEKRREDIKDSGSSNVVARASRLPKDWTPSSEDIEYCRSERPDLDVMNVAAQFRDYWVAKSGKDATKMDWSATWRNWVRRQQSGQARAAPTRSYHDERADVIAGLTGRSRHHDDERIIDIQAIEFGRLADQRNS